MATSINMTHYIEALFNVFYAINGKADTSGDKKTKYIALIIYNYMVKTAKDNNVDLREITKNDSINLSVIFDYINTNNIELYDFQKIELTDVDITRNSDLERFVLTHVYYITQKKYN